jgi:hypothetical protein
MILPVKLDNHYMLKRGKKQSAGEDEIAQIYFTIIKGTRSNAKPF